jgi:hypothetical protein
MFVIDQTKLLLFISHDILFGMHMHASQCRHACATDAPAVEAVSEKKILAVARTSVYPTTKVQRASRASCRVRALTSALTGVTG